MPLIFDNIEQTLLPALQQTLGVSDRADFCVGYFNLRGWKQLDSYVEQWAGGDGHCCRLLVGMQRLPAEELRAGLGLAKGDGGIDNQTALRLKAKLAQEFRDQLCVGAPTNDDEAGLRRLAAQIRAKKVVVKLFLRHPLHAKLYLLFRPDRVNPTVGYLGSSNLTLAGLSHQRGLTGFAGVTGDSPHPARFAWRFSPEANRKRDWVKPEDELRVLVATDVLSEGLNLHDGYVVVNFDLPWALIRLTQRAGRVDRIGQKAEQILCYYFLPADGVEQIIFLRGRHRQRLRENAEVVGTDEAFFEDEDHWVLPDLYHEKARLIDDAGVAVIGGFHSPIEQEALRLLLRGTQPIVTCPARSIERMRVRGEWRAPLAQGRLLILSPFAEKVRRPTRELAHERNRFVAALAAKVLVAHADPGGKTEDLLREVAAWGKPVLTPGDVLGKRQSLL